MNLKIIGIILIVLGIGALAFQGLTYTTQEKAVDIGPIHITRETEKTIPLPPIAGAAAVLGGAAMLYAGSRGKG